jgi:outer membrane protein TolC
VSITISCRKAWLAVAFILSATFVPDAHAQQTNDYPIDLPTVLRLAGAQNLDVQIARERLKQTEGERSAAVERFFPWISVGATYHRRAGLAQAVPAGTVSSADFESYMPGATIGAQVEIGDAIYKSLAAKQLVHASSQALEAQRQESILTAASRYFDLAEAKALVNVSREALETSRDYEKQLHEAVGAGIAFKGDELRVQTETAGYEITLRHAREQQRIAASSLAAILHLDPAVELVPKDDGLQRVVLFETNAPLDRLVQLALRSRPESLESRALVSAARDTKNGITYGPLVPTIGAQLFEGGFGGGPDDGPSRFGGTRDYIVGASWRIGPGGLFDIGHIKTTKAQLTAAELNDTKLKDSITDQVVTALTKVQSSSDQIDLTQRKLAAASETLRLTRERKEFGVGNVLEDIQAQQALTQTRSQYFTAVAEFNAAQYELAKAIGELSGTSGH